MPGVFNFSYRLYCFIVLPPGVIKNDDDDDDDYNTKEVMCESNVLMGK